MTNYVTSQNYKTNNNNNILKLFIKVWILLVYQKDSLLIEWIGFKYAVILFATIKQ